MPTALRRRAESVTLYDVCFDRDRCASKLVKRRPVLGMGKGLGDLMGKKRRGMGMLPRVERSVAIHSSTVRMVNGLLASIERGRNPFIAPTHHAPRTTHYCRTSATATSPTIC